MIAFLTRAPTFRLDQGRRSTFNLPISRCYNSGALPPAILQPITPSRSKPQFASLLQFRGQGCARDTLRKRFCSVCAASDLQRAAGATKHSECKRGAETQRRSCCQLPLV